MLSRTLCVCLLAVAGLPTGQGLLLTDAAEAPTNFSDQRMISFLRARIEANPTDARAWRLLGRAQRNDGHDAEALESLIRAESLDSENAAIHFDLALAHFALGSEQAAANHFARVLRLAPSSDYARSAEERLALLPTPENGPEIQTVGYEIKRFDGSALTESLRDDAEQAQTALPPVSARIEMGTVYNTNVALSPTNRNFVAGSAASPQAFVSPELEVRWLNTDDWRAGPLFRGYFNVNNSDFASLNLQSYQGGLFVERSLPSDLTTLVPRVQYAYTLDQFSGSTFGKRHAITTSLASRWNDGSTSVGYWTIDDTNLANDGATPSLTSQDGTTNTVGLAHTWRFDDRWLRSTTLGVDGQHADLRGSNFTFNGVSLYGSAVCPINDFLQLIVEGGWGYRDYPNATLTPSRNQNIWRANTRLELILTEHWKIAGVFSYDRFDSKNDLFQAQRTIAGVVSVFEY